MTAPALVSADRVLVSGGASLRFLAPFALIACGLVLYGALTGVAVYKARWGL